MKKLFLLLVVAFFATSVFAADNAKQILDKTASIVGSKGGAQADFTISGAKINASGTIRIKGNKFFANTPQGKVWFDGKTQWTYMQNTEEVNITTPTAAQQAQMNPMTFINLYKSGYKLSVKTVDGKYEVRMQAQGTKSIQEMYVVINKTTYTPTQVRMCMKGKWTTVNIRNFKAAKQADSVFTFKAGEYPDAEIVDLR